MPDPATVQIRNYAEAWRIWTILEAVGWRWDINQVLAQPEELLNDVITIAGLADKVRRQQKKNGR